MTKQACKQFLRTEEVTWKCIEDASELEERKGEVR